MRKSWVLMAALAAAVAVVAPGGAQQVVMPTTTRVAGGGSGGSTGGFVSGFSPTSLNFKPVNLTTAAKPTNFQQAAMPQQQSTKVFNINSAFSKIHMPLFRSGAPSTPIIKPGPGNPLQPVAPPKLKGQK